MQTQDIATLTLLEAVEILSLINDKELSLAEEKFFSSDNKKIIHLKNRWHFSLSEIKNIFKSVLKHIKDFSLKEQSVFSKDNHLSALKNMMVLLGESAKKIDHLTTLFPHKNFKLIKTSKDYKQLETFYEKNILYKTEPLLRRCQALLQKSKKFSINNFSLDTVFLDLESIKKDSDSELLLIKKQDGSRFFQSQLIQQIKLFQHFHFLDSQIEIQDFLKKGQAQFNLAKAKHLWNNTKPVISSYANFLKNFKEVEIVTLINKALIALISAQHTISLNDEENFKNCQDYLKDFQSFLVEILISQKSTAFQMLAPLTQEAVNKITAILLKTIFSEVNPNLVNIKIDFTKKLLQNIELTQSKEHLIEAKKCHKIWSYLAAHYVGLQKYLRFFTKISTQIIKSIEELPSFYSPYHQGIWPENLFKLVKEDKIITVHRLASPTIQEYIHKAKIIDEFKDFLNNCKKPLLIVSLQERNSWQEAARAIALEELEQNPLVKILTLMKDNDFYHQIGSYEKLHQFHFFKKAFLEDLLGDKENFYPSSFFDKDWISKLITAIHTLFFDDKNVLTKEMRLDFIEIFQLFLILKMVEVTDTSTVFIVSKDGVDLALTEASLIAIFLELLNHKQLKEEHKLFLSYILQTIPFLEKERPLLPERFNRFLSVIKRLENKLAEKPDFLKEVIQILTPLYQAKSFLANLSFLNLLSA